MTLAATNAQPTATSTAVYGLGFGSGLIGAVVLPGMVAGLSLAGAGWCATKLWQVAWKPKPPSAPNTAPTDDMISKVWKAISPGSRFPIGDYTNKIKTSAIGTAATLGVASIPGFELLTGTNSFILAALGGAITYIVTDVREGMRGLSPAATRRVGLQNPSVSPSRVDDQRTPVGRNILEERLPNPVEFREHDHSYKFHTIFEACQYFVNNIENNRERAIAEVAYNAFCLNPEMIPTSDMELRRGVPEAIHNALLSAANKAVQGFRRSPLI